MSTDKRWTQVTCAHCKRTYVCTPEDDFYDDIPDWVENGGLCITCLLKRSGVSKHIPIRTIIAIAGENGITFEEKS